MKSESSINSHQRRRPRASKGRYIKSSTGEQSDRKFVHIGGLPLSVKASECGRGLTDDSGSREESDGTRHTCPHPACGKDSSTSGHARRHNRIHKNQRPFVCPHNACSSTLTRKDNCTQHQRSNYRTDLPACRLFQEAVFFKKHNDSRGDFPHSFHFFIYITSWRDHCMVPFCDSRPYPAQNCSPLLLSCFKRTFNQYLALCPSVLPATSSLLLISEMILLQSLFGMKWTEHCNLALSISFHPDIVVITVPFLVLYLIRKTEDGCTASAFAPFASFLVIAD